MEEILASIRRIIADDDPSTTAQASFPANESAAPPLARPVASSPETASPGSAAAPLREPTQVEIDALLAQMREPPRQIYRPDEPASELREDGRRPQPAAAASIEDRLPRGPEERPSVPRPGSKSGLISAAVSAQVGYAFDRLAQATAAPKGPTLEELVSEMLRPMLKAWLDENLPTIVERLVQAEIERISRKQ